MNFYDNIAVQYDDMTRMHQRMEKEKRVLKNWQERYRFRSVIDVACGTGLHSIIFAMLGIKTVGVDASQKMIEKAQANASFYGAEVEFITSTMEAMDSIIQNRFDALFCLGNSMPHLQDGASLACALKNFYNVLNRSGIAVLQLLNYQRILAEKNRIVGVHRSGEREFIRFYDFAEKLVRFNVLTVSWRGDRASPELHSTTLMPYTFNDLAVAMPEAGLAIEGHYGDLNFSAFNALQSTDLVIVAQKSA
jgi:glycine/sarcosine N-methyltransferase